VVQWLPTISGLLVAAAGGVFALWARFGGDKAARRAALKNPLPPTWPEMWNRITSLETTVETMRNEKRAMANVLRDASEQWPVDVPGPVFDPDDIAALDDTMPSDWRRSSRPPSTPSTV
jgi:hypothetical protein